ncbi:MAG TPA: hypothetical protein VNG33_14800 [Polyangiaceae bacterium]|nr:hypothetical protein [Polyangiaceae bacterium]
MQAGSPPLHAPSGHSHECHPAESGSVEWQQHLFLRRRALLGAGLSALALTAVYVGVLAAANSLEHVGREVERLWLWIVPLVLGFAAQMGLFLYARGAASGRSGGVPAHGVVGSGVANATSMLACCAHHLADVLPLIGLASAGLLLARYQGVFLVLGVASNCVGLTYVLGRMKEHRLFPARPSVLSSVLRLPVERALPIVLLASTGWLAVSIFFASHR